MDDGTGKSGNVEEWMKELFPDAASTAGTGGRGVVTLPSANVNNSNQHVRGMGMGQSYQVSSVTQNSNPGMWQHSQRALDGFNNPVRQNMTCSLPALFEEFSQSQASRNMIAKVQQQQQFQNQVLGQVSDRPNMYQMRVQQNVYSNNLRQQQQNLLQQPALGGYAASHMVKHQEAFNAVQQTDQTTLQKCLESQRVFAAESMHQRLQMPAFHQSQNPALVNQMKQGNQSQAIHLGQSQVSESALQVESTNSIEWINQAYQRLLQIKDTYLSDVVMLFNKARGERSRATTNNEITRLERMRNVAEKLQRFLTMPKSDLLTCRKEAFLQMMEDALKQCTQIKGMFTHSKQTQQADTSSEASQMQQRENYYQLNNCAPPCLQPQQSLRQVASLSLPESSVNSSKEHKVDASSMPNMMQYCNPMRSVPTWTSHGNMVPSPPQKGSQMGFDQRSLRMLLHPPDGASQNINMGTPQPRNILNSMDYSACALAHASLLANKQQDQAMKRPKMKQPMQQPLPDKNKQQMLQKRSEDTNLRRLVGSNQKMSPLPQSCSSPCAASSPQTSQQSSSQLEQKDFSSKLSKSGTPSTSPSAFPSPLTPLTPSSAPADYAKSPLSLEESSKMPKTSAAPSQPLLQVSNQSQHVDEAHALSKPCLQPESTCPDNKQLSAVEEDPFKRLVNAVKAISSRALDSALNDINAVASLTDSVAEHCYGEPPKVICYDMSSNISDNEMERFISENNTFTKRRLETTVLNNLATETECCDERAAKRLKMGKADNNLLLQEVKEINHKLIEVVVDVVNTKDNSSWAGIDQGTLVRCSYVPIQFRNKEMTNASKHMFPNLVLDLIVPADYPSSSPMVVETLPPGCSEELWMKAKSKFSLLLRKLPGLISIKDMAEAWDDTTREVFLELAEQMGGGSFSTNYGKWEDCVLAV